MMCYRSGTGTVTADPQRGDDAVLCLIRPQDEGGMNKSSVDSR
jgi:hypothetical protein